MISCAISLRRFAGMTQPLQRDRFGLDPLAEPRFHLRAEIDFEAQERFQLARRLRYWRQDVRDWLEERRDESGDGAARVVEVPSVVAGKVTRWRARYVDNAGREHSRTFHRKVEREKWLDTQLSALLRGYHVAPRDARLTVGVVRQVAGGLRYPACVDRADGRGTPQDHQGALRVSAAVGGQALGRTSLDCHPQGRGPRRLLRLCPALPAF